MRKQYHFRKSKNGYYAWDVHRLVELSKGLPVETVPLDQIEEIDENYWFDHEPPTCRNIVSHIRLISEANRHYPIVLCAKGRLMDGMHRVAGALLAGEPAIRAVRFVETPKPDYVDVQPDQLPY